MRSVFAVFVAVLAAVFVYVAANFLSRMMGASPESIFGVFFIEAMAASFSIFAADWVVNRVAPSDTTVPKVVTLVILGLGYMAMSAFVVFAMVVSGFDILLAASGLGLMAGYVGAAYASVGDSSVSEPG